MTQPVTIQIRRRGDCVTAVRIAAETPEKAAAKLHEAACHAERDQPLSRFSFFNSGFRPDGAGWWIARRHGE